MNKIQEFLKKKEAYDAKKKNLFNTLQSTHSHAEIGEWSTCFPCQQRYKDFKNKKAEMGLGDPQRYLNWKKKHEETPNFLRSLPRRS